MNRSQHSALKKIVKNIATELDELSLVVDSMSNDTEAEMIDDVYLKLNDCWFWFDKWIDEQGVSDEEAIH